MSEAGGRFGLRRKLLLAFVLVSVLPVLGLAAALSTVVTRRLQVEADARLDRALRTVRDEIARSRTEAEGRVAAVARTDLPAAQAEPGAEVPDLAESLGRDRELPVLEIVDSRGRVVSSRHWPAGAGLPEQDEVFAGAPEFRMARVAQGYGAGERLALVVSVPGRWHGAPVTVRGGRFLDRDFLTRLAALMGAEVGFRDERRGRWIVSEGSALGRWTAPRLGSRSGGAVSLGGVAYRWASAPVAAGAAGLRLVVAVPRTTLDALTVAVRRFTLAGAGLALLASLLAGLVLSWRIARPARELALAARRVAAGDMRRVSASDSADEIGELARAFDAMTSDLSASRARLVQAERVAVWREMARRLAHEIKNPLFPIQVSIETLERAFAPGDRDENDAGSRAALVRDSCRTILEELDSLRRSVDEFSAFARMPAPRLAPTQVNDIVEQVLALQSARAGAVRLEKELAPGLPAVLADGQLLGRALGNLVTNAFEAMPEGGTLRVRTRLEGATVAIDVEDNGPGLTDEQRGRLFTPYYTTKERGTGLGLAIVQGILSDHGGRVDVHSRPAEGTTFSLLLPARDPGAHV